MGHYASAARSDLCYQLQNGVTNSKRQDQKKNKKNRNQDGIKITLEEEMQSEISKDRRDGFLKGGQSILKWTQYHRVNPICILQCNYNSFKLPVRIKSVLCRTWLWYQENLVTPCFPKYVETESRRESATYIREKNTPRIHAKPKVTWTSYKSKP